MILIRRVCLRYRRGLPSVSVVQVIDRSWWRH